MLDKGYFRENARLDNYQNRFDESDVFMIRTIISKCLSLIFVECRKLTFTVMTPYKGQLIFTKLSIIMNTKKQFTVNTSNKGLLQLWEVSKKGNFRSENSE